MKKQCSKCKKVKIISEFYPDKSKKDRHCFQCKQCSRVYSEKYRINHLEQVKITKRKWRKAHPEYCKIATIKYQKKYPERVKMTQKKQKAKRRGAVGNHTLEQWETLKNKYNSCCATCGRQEPFTDLWYQFLTEDHIIPISKGGSNFIDNIQPLCMGCNSKKGNNII